MRIDIWCAFCDRLADPVLLERYRRLLTDAERAQQARFHFESDRHRYLVTRALLRTTLSRYADVAPEDWTFVANAYGRPAIANAGIAGLTFNLSHSRKLVALAIARGCELGIDTEDTLTRTPPLEIADRFFAPEEVASLRALPEEQRLQRFFQHWTLKESYIKARGRGLSLPLDQFAFHFAHPEQVRLTVQPRMEDAADNWEFWQWWVAQPESPAGHAEAQLQQHMLALCVQRVRGDSPQIVLREVAPFRSECDLSSTLLARSPAGTGIAAD